MSDVGCWMRETGSEETLEKKRKSEILKKILPSKM
jgi:hypothetical protein